MFTGFAELRLSLRICFQSQTKIGSQIQYSLYVATFAVFMQNTVFYKIQYSLYVVNFVNTDIWLFLQ